MFGGVKEAQKFAEKKKDYVIFRLVWHKKFNEFSWALLPYGNHSLYEKALRFYHKHRGKKEILERLFRL